MLLRLLTVLYAGHAASASGTHVFAALAAVHCRAMRRSESMHKRMKQLVVQAKMLTEHNSKRQELVGIRCVPAG